MANGIEFRLFVSSTFADTTVERNALQKHVFPQLQQLCAGRGARFHAIDLRWGVTEEAAFDQQTVNICLDEVRRCLATGRAPNFLILLGNRYGWLPPPPQIPASEFSRLLDRIDKASQRKRLLKWYELDKNAVPAEYRLKAREGKYREPTTWSREETRLRQTLVTAANRMRLPAARRRCFADSATAQEINVGVLDPGNTRALCYFRRIPNIEHSQALGPYLDQGIRGQWDRQSAKRLADLKHRLRKLLPSENIHEFEAKWSVSQKRVTRGHIQSFCKRVEADLKRMILAELERAEKISELQREIQAHTDFGRQRSMNFVGRKDIVRAIEGYVKGDGNRPLVVYGPSGCGKTALIAHCAERLSSTGSDIAVASTTPYSPRTARGPFPWEKTDSSGSGTSRHSSAPTFSRVTTRRSAVWRYRQMELLQRQGVRTIRFRSGTSGPRSLSFAISRAATYVAALSPALERLSLWSGWEYACGSSS